MNLRTMSWAILIALALIALSLWRSYQDEIIATLGSSTPRTPPVVAASGKASDSDEVFANENATAVASNIENDADASFLRANEELSVSDGAAVPPRDDPFRVLTPENANQFFWIDLFAATAELMRATDSEEYALEWSSKSTGVIEDLLIKAEVMKHAEDAFVDCRRTICAVSINSSLRGFDEKELIGHLAAAGFQTVIWTRHDKSNMSYVFLLTSDFRFERGG